VSPAYAADLGGNCCADLEERVAELEATTARKGNRRVSLTITGQVSTALMAWSDDNDDRGSDTYVVDNVPSGGSFFAFNGSAKINPSLSAGFNITVAFDTGARSHQVSQKDDDGTGTVGGIPTGARTTGGFDTDIVVTLANWYLDHSQIGRITVGRANTATAGLTTIDLGGAGVIANANIGYWQRGMFLANNDALQSATWATALGGNTVNGSSLSRGNVISYTSPTFGGFSAQAAWGEDDVWDVALRYAGELSGFRVAAGIGYIHNGSGLGDINEEFVGSSARPTQVKGSASILHVATGLYLTGAYLNQDNDTAGRPDTTLWYLQGGIAKNWTGLGNTVIYGEYARVDDPSTGLLAEQFGAFDDFFVVTSSRADVWGVGIVQHVDAAAMELFLAYRRYSAEATAVDTLGQLPDFHSNFNDFDVVMGGARIRF
jgi:predicted porin